MFAPAYTGRKKFGRSPFERLSCLLRGGWPTQAISNLSRYANPNIQDLGGIGTGADLNPHASKPPSAG